MHVSEFQLVIQARRKPAGTYTYVIARRDDPAFSKTGSEVFMSPEEAAEAGRLAIQRLDRSVQS
jgi:hypothetical protein